MKRTIIILALLAASANVVLSQSYEPEFIGEAKLICINGTDTLAIAPELSTVVIKTKKKTSLLGKVVQGVEKAAQASSGLGIAIGGARGASTAVNGARVASAASTVGTALDAADKIAGNAFIASSFSIKGRSSACQVQLPAEFYIIVRVEDNSVNPLSAVQIMRLEQKKKERTYDFAEVDGSGESQIQPSNVVPNDARKYGENSYILRIEPSVGEYAISTALAYPMVYCFTMTQ